MRGYSVFPRAGRPVWYITHLCAETGTWKQVATPFRIDDPLGHKRAAKLAEQRTAQFYRSANTTHRESWAAWVRPFLKSRYRGLTLTRYDAAWDNLNSFLTKRRVANPSQLNYNHVQDFIDWRTAQVRNNGKKITRNNAIYELKLMGVIMREAKRKGYATDNPCEKMGLMRDPQKEKRELTDAELSTLRAFATAKEQALPLADRWMSTSLEIAMHQGCRLMECGVPLSDVSEERMTITFRGKGRNNQPRIFTTALHPNLLPLLKDLRSQNATHTCHMPKMAGKIWFFAFRDAGVKDASFHCTRVTVITRMARAGVPEQQARRYVNHSSKAVHSIYQKLKAEDLGSCTAALKFPAPG